MNTDFYTQIKKSGYEVRVDLGLISCAFFDLGPGVAEADGAIEYQFLARIAVDAIITKALELILGSRLCVSQTRFYHAIVQYLQRLGIQIFGEIVSFFDVVRILFNKKIFVESNLCR